MKLFPRMALVLTLGAATLPTISYANLTAGAQRAAQTLMADQAAVSKTVGLMERLGLFSNIGSRDLAIIKNSSNPAAARATLQRLAANNPKIAQFLDAAGKSGSTEVAKMLEAAQKSGVVAQSTADQNAQNTLATLVGNGSTEMCTGDGSLNSITNQLKGSNANLAADFDRAIRQLSGVRLADGKPVLGGFGCAQMNAEMVEGTAKLMINLADQIRDNRISAQGYKDALASAYEKTFPGRVSSITGGSTAAATQLIRECGFGSPSVVSGI